MRTDCRAKLFIYFHLLNHCTPWAQSRITLAMNGDTASDLPSTSNPLPQTSSASPVTVATPPAAPPAASTVVNGDKKEGDVALLEENKKLKSRLSILEDENHRLKTTPAPAPPTTPATAQKSSWLNGLPFFEE